MVVRPGIALIALLAGLGLAGLAAQVFSGSAAMAATTERVVTVGVGDPVMFWHVPTGRQLMAIETPFQNWLLLGVRFSPGGAVMAVGLPGQIQLFRAPSLAEFDTLASWKAGQD